MILILANDRSVVLLTEAGYLKRMPVNDSNLPVVVQGVKLAQNQEDDDVKLFISCNDHDTLLLFSDRGVAYALPAYRVPMSSRTAKDSISSTFSNSKRRKNNFTSCCRFFC